jgi:hypothetical protein
MAKERSKKNDSIKLLVKDGHITTIRAIFDYTAPTPAAKHLGTSYGRLLKLIDKVELFRVNELFQLGRYYELDEDTMLMLLMNQYREGISKKKARGK